MFGVHSFAAGNVAFARCTGRDPDARDVVGEHALVVCVLLGSMSVVAKIANVVAVIARGAVVVVDGVVGSVLMMVVVVIVPCMIVLDVAIVVVCGVGVVVVIGVALVAWILYRYCCV